MSQCVARCQSETSRNMDKIEYRRVYILGSSPALSRHMIQAYKKKEHDLKSCKGNLLMTVYHRRAGDFLRIFHDGRRSLFVLLFPCRDGF